MNCSDFATSATRALEVYVERGRKACSFALAGDDQALHKALKERRAAFYNFQAYDSSTREILPPDLIRVSIDVNRELEVALGSLGSRLMDELARAQMTRTTLTKFCSANSVKHSIEGVV